MVKNILVALLLFCSAQNIFAQEVSVLLEKGNAYLRAQDYDNAVLVLRNAWQQKPTNIDAGKSLAQAFYYAGRFTEANEVGKNLIALDNADDLCFKIQGDILMSLNEGPKIEKHYRKAIKKINNSGLLYYELGRILLAKQDYSAIKQWEKGIEVAPNFTKNYYEAAKFYYRTQEKVYGLLYAETFLSFEPNGNYAAEMKSLLLNGYKKLFLDGNLQTLANKENEFAKAYLQTIIKHADAVNTGITTANLIMLRTRFITEWETTYEAAFAVKLFEYHKQLLQEGVFEVYNHWIFSSADNLMAYQNWTQNNKAVYMEFLRLQQNRLFKIPMGQYYK
jgi:tetratricopeptide (TPR) repeat protein